MGAVIDRVDLPLMRVRTVRQVREAGILEAKAWTTEICMRRDANHSIHDLIEQAAM